MTPIFNAEPWLKSASLAGSKLSSVLPSKPAPNTIVGFEQLPKSRFDELLAAVAGAEFPEAAGAEFPVLLLEAVDAFPAPVVFAVLLLLDAALAEFDAVLVEVVAAPPLTAALISSAVASSTSKFCVKIHPVASFATSPSQT
jgi:hypothetical protein